MNAILDQLNDMTFSMKVGRFVIWVFWFFLRNIAIFETYFICNISYFALYSAGGLVTAVAPVVIDCKGQWIGWTGLDDFNEVVDTIPESDPDDKAPTAGLLSKQVFYNIVLCLPFVFL